MVVSHHHSCEVSLVYFCVYCRFKCGCRVEFQCSLQCPCFATCGELHITILTRPAFTGAQRWHRGKHLESAKAEEEDILQTDNCTHCLGLTCPSMIDLTVRAPAGFSQIRGREPVNLVMTEQVASHAS